MSETFVVKIISQARRENGCPSCLQPDIRGPSEAGVSIVICDERATERIVYETKLLSENGVEKKRENSYGKSW